MTEKKLETWLYREARIMDLDPKEVMQHVKNVLRYERKIARLAFTFMANSIVTEQSGCEPHPQLEHEMLTEYKRTIKLFKNREIPQSYGKT